MTSGAGGQGRLAKNTVTLYLRTLFTMGVGLYTSRVLLSVLGVDDFGIFSVVGSFVLMFSVASGTIMATTQRYLTFELGRGEQGRAREVFSAAMVIHLGLAVVLLAILEGIGVWFLNSKMNIAPERMEAANLVFQASLGAFLLKIAFTPYNAVVIARERMNVFAYLGMLEVALRLAAILVTPFLPYDRLVSYAVLILASSAIMSAIYWAYGRSHFPETRFMLVRDKGLYRGMFGFAGMNFLGSFSSILSDQGVNVVLNLFSGVAANASRGIAVQVQNSIGKFVNDFMTALNPQITKLCAQNDVPKMMELVYQGARFSFYLMLLFAVPVAIEAPMILHAWLAVVPENAVLFVRLTLVMALVETLSNPLITAILATGNIKSFSLWIGGLRLLVLPACYVLMRMGYPAATVYYVNISMNMLLLFVRLLVVRGLVHVPVYGYVEKVLFKVVPTALAALASILMLRSLLPGTPTGALVFLPVGMALLAVIIWIVGMGHGERLAVKAFVAGKWSHIVERRR